MNIFSLLFYDAVHRMTANRPMALMSAIIGAALCFQMWLDLTRGWVLANRFTLRRASRDEQPVEFWCLFGLQGMLCLFFLGCGLRGIIGPVP